MEGTLTAQTWVTHGASEMLVWMWFLDAGAVGRAIRQKVLLYAPPALGKEHGVAQQSGKHFVLHVTSKSPAILKSIAVPRLPFAISFCPVSFFVCQTFNNPNTIHPS